MAPPALMELGWPVRDGGIRYYGSSDATSWFLVVLDATGDAALQRDLAPARAAAARWLDGTLRAGGGFVRCGPRRFPGGLAQQGWRDSLDPARDANGGGIVRPDGSMPTAPLADADSQAVAIAALDALTRLDGPGARGWSQRAAQLRARVQRVFTPEVLALDGVDRPVSGAGSQLGWLLWAGALDAPSTDRAVARLTRDDVLTPFGVRTLAATHPAFRVDGYHRGAIWPFDSWLAWGGLRRVGALDAADRVRGGVLRALDQLGRYPELYAVDRDRARPRVGPRVRPIEVANRVQAWTVGARLALETGWDGRV